MKKRPFFLINRIGPILLLPLLLTTGLWTWLTLFSAQAQNSHFSFQNPKSSQGYINEIQNPEEDTWRTLDTPFEHIGQVLEDKEGNIWVVSQAEDISGQGLTKFRQGRWITFTVESTNGGLPSDSIHDALFDQGGDLWLAVGTNEKITNTLRTIGNGVVRFDGQTWRTFTVTNTHGGLADDNVNDIFEDDTGQLWFATLSGLSRYDGKTWEVVATNDDVGAEGIFRVLKDRQNRLWVSLIIDSEISGVARSTPMGVDGRVKEWQTFTETDGLAKDSVLSLAEDAEGYIWLGMALHGVSRFDGHKWETFNSGNNDFSGSFVNQIVNGYEGQVWAATDRGTAIYHAGQWQPFGLEVPVQYIFKDSEGIVWFSTGDSLRYYTGYHWKNFSKENNDSSSNIRKLLEGSDGAVWVIRSGGDLNRYQSGEWQSFSTKSSNLISKKVWYLLRAHDGAIWVGTLGGGVSRYQNGEWQTFTKENSSLKSDDIRQLFEAKDGAIWAGTWGGVSRYQNGEWQTFTKENSSLKSDDIWQLFEARDGAIWAGTWGGVSRYQNGEWQTFTKENSSLKSDDIRQLFEAKDGAIWVGTWGGGAGRYQNDTWQTFSIEGSNLDRSKVGDLFEGNDGAIWVGTNNAGISRYQSGVWQTFSVKSGELTSNNVQQLFEGSDGAIWAALWGGGVARYQKGKWQIFDIKSGQLNSNKVPYLFETNNGVVWAGTDRGELSRYQNEKWQTFNDVGVGDLGRVWYLLRAGDGTIWVATLSNGVSRYQKGEWQSFNIENGNLNSNDVRQLLEADDGSIWVGTWGGGVSRYRDGEWQAFSMESGNLGSDNVWDLFETSQGTIWVRTQGGVSRYQDGKWQSFSEKSGDLGSNEVQNLFEANDGSIWVRTQGGVSQYQNGKWQTFSQESGDLGSSEVQNLFKADDGSIWAWTRNGGVSRYQDGKWQTFSQESGDLGSSEVQNLFKADDGSIWVRTQGGVSRYQDGKWQTFSQESGDLGSNEVQDLFKADDGSIWAWTQNGGVSRYQDGKWQTFSQESGDLGSNEVEALGVANDGAIWVRTRDRGVSRYQDGKWQTFNKENGDLGSNSIQDWLQAGDEGVWIRTWDRGVSRYQDGKWQTFNVASGDLNNDYITSWLEASDGAIWVRTWGGEVRRYQDGKWQTFTDKEYDAVLQESNAFLAVSERLQADGISQRQLTDHEGFVWTTTDAGLIRSRSSRRPPWVQITTFNSISLTTTTHTIAYDDHQHVSIVFEGNDLATRPENLHYFYKLENSPVFTDWQVIAYNEPLFLFVDQITPGQHNFLLKAIDEDGNESESARLDITVESLLQIQEIPVEPGYVLRLGLLTLPQWFSIGVGIVILWGLISFGTAVWSKRRQALKDQQVQPLPEEYFNPYTIGPPVTGDKFVGRQHILTDLVTALKANNHLIIEGERRIGKTSLLYKLAEALRQDGDYYFIPAYVQLQRVIEEKLFYAIMREVARESRRGAEEQLPPLRCEAPYVQYDTFDAEDDLQVIVKTMQKTTSLPVRVVILLDEGDRLRDFSEETHSHLRGWMGADTQKDVLLLVWCGVSFDRAWHKKTSPWYNQFRSSLEIPPLTEAEAATLITRPVEGYYRYEPEAVERILTLSQGKPFIIQLIGDESMKHLWQKQAGAVITLADVEVIWPLVQHRLESDEQADVSEDTAASAPIDQPAMTNRQIAEEPTPYQIESEQPSDDA